MNNKRKSVVLVAAVLAFLVFLIAVPVIVNIVRQDTHFSVKTKRQSVAFNLAEAAVERGYWKIKNSTSTFQSVMDGNTLTGYNFDVIYNDIPGGTYRISITSGPVARSVTIIGEGRDSTTKETRAIKVIYQNQTIFGAIISGSMINPSGDTRVHWGPIMAMGDINLSRGQANVYYPRKFSSQLVKPRDHSLDPPNTDNIEWWSAYDVPELPQLDFVTMRSSAAANGTLNCGGRFNRKPAKPMSSNGYIMPCNCNYSSSNKRCCADQAKCYVDNIYADKRYDDNLIWYWDEGKTVYLDNTGIKGTIIVRGDLSITGDDCYGPWYTVSGYDPYWGYHTCGKGPSSESGPGALNVKVPSEAYLEYQAIDTSATDEYPADLGLSSSAAVYQIGSCGQSAYYLCDSSCEENCEGGATGDDIGLNGFLYVGGDLTISQAFDVYGAMWVVGDMNTGGGNNVSIFFNDELDLPTLNVVLIRKSWQEITPSSIPW